MRLDLDLVRRLLVRVNERRHDDDAIDLSIDGYDSETVSEHVRLLDRLGYVAAIRVWTSQGEVWKSARITSKGADLLARASDDAVWKRAKQRVEERVVGSSEFKLDILKGLLDWAPEERPGNGRKETGSEGEASQ
jgi:hypothetical protein